MSTAVFTNTDTEARLDDKDGGADHSQVNGGEEGVGTVDVHLAVIRAWIDAGMGAGKCAHLRLRGLLFRPLCPGRVLPAIGRKYDPNRPQ